LRCGLHRVDGRVMAQPQLQEVQEDLLAREIGVVEQPSLCCPVRPQLSAHSLPEDRELIKFIFALTAKQVKLGVIVDLPLGLLIVGGF
jgi:hypothetical protein